MRAHNFCQEREPEEEQEQEQEEQEQEQEEQEQEQEEQLAILPLSGLVLCRCAWRPLTAQLSLCQR